MRVDGGLGVWGWRVMPLIVTPAAACGRDAAPQAWACPEFVLLTFCSPHMPLVRPRVTWKADGTRYMLVLMRWGTYLIDRKFAIRRVQVRGRLQAVQRTGQGVVYLPA